VLTRMRRFFAPPIFKDDPESTYLAYLLNTILLVEIAVYLASHGVLSPVLSVPLSSQISAAMMVLVLIGLWLMMRSGRLRLASILYLSLSWIQESLAVFRWGGLHSPSLMSLFILVYIAGLLLGWPGVLAGIGLGVVTSLVALAAELRGTLPSPVAFIKPAYYLIAFLTNLILLTALVYLSNRGRAKALENARQELAERRRVEEERLKFELGIERSADAIYMTDTEGKIVYVNPAFERMYGYAKDEVLGSTPQLLKSDVAADFYGQFWQTLLSKEVIAGESVNRAKDGRLLNIEGSANPIVSEAGKIIGFLAIHRDVTERKRAEEEKAKLEDRLRQAHKMETIGQLAGGVAHDFNNLLSPILGYAELMLADLKPDDPQFSNVALIKGAAERAANLTRQLLSFSRKQMLDMKTLDLNRIVTDFERILRTTIREDIDLTLSLAPALGSIKGDISQVEQIILNLASNAQDALPAGGSIRIETANVQLDEEFCQAHPFVTSGPYVLLSICDSGIGMDRRTLQHIFEPFYTTKELGKGTGLGLATVYGIVKQHCGYILVASEPARGTVFQVYLPRVEERADHKAPAPINESEKRGSETVVVVEDDVMVCNLACSILKKKGYNVIDVLGAEECLRILEKQHSAIDLLITDVIMPKMNGRELYERLAVTYPGLKVLYMSGYADNVISVHGVLEEGVHFIQKPFSVQALSSKVREVLDSSP